MYSVSPEAADAARATLRQLWLVADELRHHHWRPPVVLRERIEERQSLSDRMQPLLAEFHSGAHKRVRESVLRQSRGRQQWAGWTYPTALEAAIGVSVRLQSEIVPELDGDSVDPEQWPFSAADLEIVQVAGGPTFVERFDFAVRRGFSGTDELARQLAVELDQGPLEPEIVTARRVFASKGAAAEKAAKKALAYFRRWRTKMAQESIR